MGLMADYIQYFDCADNGEAYLLVKTRVLSCLRQT